MLDDLDNTIDEVAREITAARVDDSFARRVSVRIEDADAAPAARVWSRTWLLVPATAGVLLLAVFLTRSAQSPSSIRPGPGAATDASANATPSATSNGTADGSTVAAAVASTAGPTPVRALRSAALAVARPRDPDFDPLVTPPIEMASLDVSPLTGVMPIEIAAIAIERIEISAMP